MRRAADPHLDPQRGYRGRRRRAWRSVERMPLPASAEAHQPTSPTTRRDGHCSDRRRTERHLRSAVPSYALEPVHHAGQTPSPLPGAERLAHERRIDLSVGLTPASSMVRRRFIRRLRSPAPKMAPAGVCTRHHHRARRPARRSCAGSGRSWLQRSFARREDHRGRLDAACDQNVQELRPHACGLEFARRRRRSWSRPLRRKRKISCVVIISSSMPTTSAIETTRRRPSSMRSTWMTMLMADAICWRIERGEMSSPAMPIICSIVQGVARAVGVDGGHRAVVPRVHRLQHVEGLAGAHFADDDPVGPHPQGVAHQFAAGSPRPCPRCWPAGFPAATTCGCCICNSAASSMVTMRSLFVDVGRQGVEQRGLARAGAAGDQHVAARFDDGLRTGRPFPP